MIALNWLLEYNVSHEDFRLAGGVPLLILISRRGPYFKPFIEKLNEKFVAHDLWLKKFEKHPYTYGKTGEISGKKYDQVLTDKGDHGNMQTLDYIFEISEKKSQHTNPSENVADLNQKKNLIIDYNSMKVEEFLIEGKPFQQLSDHFGASVEIIYKNKKSSLHD